MTLPRRREVSERIEESKARGLCRVLELSLEENATALAHAAARDVARLMALPGLEQLVAASARHPASRRPRELVLVLDRVRRLMAASESGGSIAPFVEADAELRALAQQVSALVWGPAADAAGSVLSTVAIEEALGGRPTEGGAGDLRLRASVAAAVRAACDWLAPDAPGRVRVERHDDAVVFALRVHAFEHIEPAGEVLAEAGGSLTPSSRRDGTWELRVPGHVARPTVLLLEHGGLSLALPWHAVLRLRMTAHASALDEAPVLSLPGGGGAESGERPAALVAHGLRRAWVFADRVVWRLAATPESADSAPPIADATHFVRDADDRHWWLLEPGRLLAGLPLPAATFLPERDAHGIVTEVVDVPGREAIADAPAHAAESPPPLRVMPSLTGPGVPAPVGDEREVAPPLTGPPRMLLAGDVEALESATRVEPAPEERDPTARSSPEAASPDASAREAHAAGAEPPPAPDSAGTVTPAAAAPLPATAEPPPARPLPAAVDRAPALPPAPAPAAPPPARAQGPEGGARHVLVAEDSIVASIFLQRMLGQRGFEVVTVDSCAALMDTVGGMAWAAVFVDVRLPDSPAGRHLHALIGHRESVPEPFALVALVTDPDDETLARDAGIRDALRKPFDAGALDRRLAALGFAAPGRA